MATPHYVNSDIGDDDDTGLLLGAPKATIADTLADYPAIGNGDSINTGEHITETIADSNRTGLIIQQEPTYAATQWRGSLDPSEGGGVWSVHHDKTYKIGTEASLDVESAHERFTILTFSNGRHGGYMVKMGIPAVGANLSRAGGSVTVITATSPAVFTSTAHGLATGSKIVQSGTNCTPVVDGIYDVEVVSANTYKLKKFGVYVNCSGAGTAGTWVPAADGLFAYDDALGVFYARMANDGDPGSLGEDDRVRLINASWSFALQIVTGTGNNIRNLLFQGFQGTLAAQPVNALAIDGTGNTVENCDFHNAGDVHTILFTGALGGNVASNCRFYGQGNTNASSYIVHYSNQGNVTGRVDGCQFHCHSALDASGDSIDNTLNIGACYAHTDAAGGRVVSNIERTGCRAWYYQNPGTAFDAGDTAALSGSVYEYNSYPVRHTECEVYNAASHSSSGSIAFRRCYFDLSQNPNFLATLLWQTVTGASLLFESTTIVVDLNRTGSIDRTSLFYLATGSQVTFINCNVIVLTATTQKYHTMFTVQNDAGFTLGSAGWKIRAYLTNFIFTSPDGTASCENDFIISDTSSPHSNLEFSSCNILNVNANQYSYNANRNTLAEWRTNVDPNTLAISPGFQSPTTVDRDQVDILSSSSLLHVNTVLNPSRWALSDRRGNPFAGYIGNYQPRSGNWGRGWRSSRLSRSR